MPNTMAMFIRILGTVGRSTTTAAGTRRTNPNRTGRARKIISNEREANRISNERHLKQVRPIDLAKAAATTDPAKLARSGPVAASIDPVVKVGLVIWIAKLRTDRVATFRASVSKTPNAAAVAILAIVLVAAVAVIALGVAGSAAVIALGAVALAEGAALVDLAAAAGVDGKI
jgi:hypothetical protein